MKKIYTYITTLFLTLLSTPILAVDAKNPIVKSPLGDSDLKTLFTNLLDVVQTIMIMVATIYIIYAGFMFVTAKGDTEKIKKARTALLWGLIGAALILCAEVLAMGLGDTVKDVFKQ